MAKSHPDFPLLKILDLLQADDVELLIGELAQGDRDKLPVGQLLNFVLPHGGRDIGCRSVVVEESYVDRNFAIAYAQFYSRAFHEFQRRTKRFHFFSESVEFDSLTNESKLQSGYLGFCIVSPSEPRTLGRTVVAPPKGSAQEFVTCQGEFSVNLAGAKLTAHGAPFIQQDGRVAACATAALWSAVMVASRTFEEISSTSTTEITELGTKYTLGPYGRTHSPGLNLDQMMWALNELGYVPLKYSPNDHLAARDLVYSYVESRLPPILVLRLPNIDEHAFHAVAVVGHTYDKSYSPPNDRPMTYGYYYSASEWCPQFVAHCDQNGPYHRLTIGPATPTSRLRPTVIFDTTGLTSNQASQIADFYTRAELWDIITLVPPRVFLKAEEAGAKGRALLRWAYAEHKTAPWPANPVFRTYLVPSNDFKRRLVPGQVTELSEHLSRLYRGLHLSRYVWVTEVCDLEDRVKVDTNGLRICGEALVDGTSSASWMDFLAVHIPGRFLHMSPEARDFAKAMVQPILVQDDRPFQPLIRPDC